MSRKVYPRLDVELAIMDAFPPRRGLVYEMSCNGFSNDQIGERLGISSRTVEWHLDEVKNQLCALNIKDAISQGWLHGLLRAKSVVRACALVLAIFSSMHSGYARLPRSPGNARAATASVRLVRQEGHLLG